MSLTFLRSGSSGNCTLVEYDGTRVLVDAGGQSRKRFHALLAEAELETSDIDAVVVTHLHGDHLNQSTLRICRRFALPLWLHTTNAEHLPYKFAHRYLDGVMVRPFQESFALGGLRFEAFEVSHDAPGITCGLRFCPAADPLLSVAYATDLGHFPGKLRPAFESAAAVVIEANHDTELLWDNPRRTWAHKQRVGGNHGHLSNDQTAEALVGIFRCAPRPPRTVVLAHLSGDHNSPQQALDTIGKKLDRHELYPNLVSAFRDRRTPTYRIGTGGDGGTRALGAQQDLFGNPGGIVQSRPDRDR